jgi:hypothetical protein
MWSKKKDKYVRITVGLCGCLGMYVKDMQNMYIVEARREYGWECFEAYSRCKICCCFSLVVIFVLNSLSASKTYNLVMKTKVDVKIMRLIITIEGHVNY